MKKFRWILFSLLTLVIPFGSSIQATSPDSEEDGDIPAIVWRFYNRVTGDHFYGYGDEAISLLKDIQSPENLHNDNYLWAVEDDWYVPPTGDPVYRVYNANSGEHFYTASPNEREALKAAGWKDEGFAFYSNTPDKDPVYRLFNPKATNAGSHLFTRSMEEVESLTRLGWKNEGIVWYVTDYPDPYYGAAN